MYMFGKGEYKLFAKYSIRWTYKESILLPYEVEFVQ